MAVPPAAVSASTVWSMPAWSRAATTTLTPLAARARHVAAPMPLDPPVTTATRPARSGYVGIVARTASATRTRPCEHLRVDRRARRPALETVGDLLRDAALQVVLGLGGVEGGVRCDQGERVAAQRV